MTPRERFWDVLRPYRGQLRLLRMFATSLLVLALLAMALGEQGTEAYVVSVVTVALLAGTIVPVSYCIYRLRPGRGASRSGSGDGVEGARD
ncbi:hypothetical protein JCM17823_05900 [Halorubrum gandharaense]